MNKRQYTPERWQAEYMLVYSIIVAGKSAKFAKGATERFLAHFRATDKTIFGFIERLLQIPYLLENTLRHSRSGNYTKLRRAFQEVVMLDALTCTLDQLESIHGIGPKTARFFLMWSRPGIRHAALDVHVLRWLRAQGYDVPKSIPQASMKYAEIEHIFLELADQMKVTPRELDSAIWEAGSGHA